MSAPQATRATTAAAVRRGSVVVGHGTVKTWWRCDDGVHISLTFTNGRRARLDANHPLRVVTS